MPPRQDDWSGPRPLATRAPYAVIALLAVVLAVAIVLAVRRDVDVPGQVAAHYVDMMAGTLRAELESADAASLERALAQKGAGFTPRIRSLEPDFTLAGGGLVQIEGRPAAFWYYRDRRSDVILAAAFTGSLAEVGQTTDVRNEAAPPLHVYRKATQTVVFWRDGAQVYTASSTLPGERAVAMARRLASGTKPAR
ncbi:MAG TPA: hypothetical protein VNK41_00955 [Vicinamibacterales bacterium]|nr:hypothetical protein [Vicinamibacterales bacterium]